MRCLLVFPNWTFAETHLRALRKDVAGRTVPSGIFYIGAVLRKAGHEVCIIDGAFYTKQQILDQMRTFNPQLVGISTVSMLWTNAKSLAEEVKKQHPQTFIVVGGPHPTAVGEMVLEECEAIDAVGYGEGEFTTLELAEALEKGQPLDAIKGLIYRCKSSGDTGSFDRRGKIVRNTPRPLLEDLDSLPYPAFDLIDIKMYRPSLGHYKRLPSIGVVLSRGCPMNCLYCYKLCGNTIRTRSPVKVADEIEFYVQKYGIRDVKFWTELFTAERQVVMDFCDEIIHRQLDIAWSCAARVDTVDEELLRKMKQAGCWYLQYGIESGVQKNLNTLRKGTTIQNIENAIALTHKVGLESFCTYILGIPGETYEEALKTIEFACKLNSFYAEFFPLTPFPGTDLYRDVKKYGRLIGSIDELTLHHMPFVPYTMSEDQLRSLQILAYRKYYARPRYMLMRLLKIRSLEDLRASWQGFKAFVSLTT